MKPRLILAGAAGLLTVAVAYSQLRPDAADPSPSVVVEPAVGTMQALAASTDSNLRRQASEAAFFQVASVLTHPRCQNCHTMTDFPRQGDDRHRHVMNVRRGPDGHGLPGMTCTTCHNRANNQASSVPGADEDWHLAPLSMSWEGKTLTELCENLKNPAMNGGRSGEKELDHLETHLVKWAWEPGRTRSGQPRSLPPLSHAEFTVAAERWLGNGAACPVTSRRAPITGAP